MKRILPLTIAPWLVAGAVMAVEAEVSQSGIQSAIRMLRSEYIRGSELGFTELNRAALEGLLNRLQLGASLVPTDSDTDASEEPRVLHKVLAGKVGWVSPVTFHRSEADLLQSALKELRRVGASSLVLDLRSPCADADFDAAAEMLDLFVPPAEVLFKLQQVGRPDAELFLSRETALWSEPLIVLIDGDSCNVAETIAAVLKDRGAALLMGQPTRGATVRFETQPIDSEFSLRFARAEMLLPDGTSLFRKGLVPEFPVAMDAETKIAAVELQREGKVGQTVFDRARVRYNEAALVARKNPEIDAYIRRSAGEETEADRVPVRDLVLQRAVDMLMTRAFMGQAKIQWRTPEPAPEMDEPQIPKAIPATAP